MLAGRFAFHKHLKSNWISTEFHLRLFSSLSLANGSLAKAHLESCSVILCRNMPGDWSYLKTTCWPQSVEKQSSTLSGLSDKTFYSSQILFPPQKEISEERIIENQLNAIHIKLYVRMSADQISVKLLTLVSVVKLVWKVNTPITLEGTLEIIQSSLLLKAGLTLKSEQDFVQ